MVELDFSKCKLKPYAHQEKGVRDLLQSPRIDERSLFALFWEMRVGKTKVIADTMNFLFESRELDVVVICCPAQVKDVWLDPDLGEIQKHSWVDMEVIDWNLKAESRGVSSMGWPQVLVSSLEFMAQGDPQGKYHHAETLMAELKGRRVWLVIDEAQAVANHKAHSTKAMMRLRECVNRITILDGTPEGEENDDYYSKFAVLDKQILGYKSYAEFCRSHVVMQRKFGNGVYYPKKIGFRNLGIIIENGKKYVSRLTQDQCMDMPEWVEQFTTVRLTEKTWKVYCDMRDEMIAQLENRELTVQNANVRGLRLAQICSGFVGGLDDVITGEKETVELGSESTDHIQDWLNLRHQENPHFKCVIWCRWQAEIRRLVMRLRKAGKFEFDEMAERWVKSKNSTSGFDVVGQMWGEVKQDYEPFHPDYPSGFDREWSGVLIAQPQAGRFGKNFSRAAQQVFLSQDYSKVTRAQAKERIQAPNGRKTSGLLDVFVSGPDGQRTIVHDIIRTLHSKEEVTTRSKEQWLKALAE